VKVKEDNIKLKKEQFSRYQLRCAAGMYWLLDMEQAGVPYKPPFTMNCVGADIWEMLKKGKNREQIIEELCIEYQADRSVIEEDTDVFLEQLKQYGVTSDEGEIV